MHCDRPRSPIHRSQCNGILLLSPCEQTIYATNSNKNALVCLNNTVLYINEMHCKRLLTVKLKNM